MNFKAQIIGGLIGAVIAVAFCAFVLPVGLYSFAGIIGFIGGIGGVAIGELVAG